MQRRLEAVRVEGRPGLAVFLVLVGMAILRIIIVVGKVRAADHDHDALVLVLAQEGERPSQDVLDHGLLGRRVDLDLLDEIR